jgi:cadherin 23
VTPEKGINEASFIIRVKDPSLLDFETLKVVNFELVAREMTETDPKESRVPVTVHVRDRNDNQVREISIILPSN